MAACGEKCLGTHRENLDQNLIVSKGKAAVSSRHRPWDETREAEGVFCPICSGNVVLDECKKQGILRELEERGLECSFKVSKMSRKS